VFGAIRRVALDANLTHSLSSLQIFSGYLMSSVLRPDISPGQIAQIRQRTYLVEEVVKPKREATEANGKKKTKRTRKKKAEA